MKRVKSITTALVLAALVVVASRVAAQETNASERTFLTFSSSVELPGLSLQPGTYVFKLADTTSRNVVQVWNQQEKEMLGQWLFVQAERNEVSGENVVMFRETAAGSTPAVQYWYFPGEKVGKEFIYPKDQAMRIAARTGSSVLTGEGEVQSIDAKGNATAWERAESSKAPGIAADSTLTNAPASAQPSAAAGSLAGNRGVEPESRIDSDARIDAEPPQAQAQAETPAPASSAAPAPAASPAPAPVGTSGVQQESQVARAELPRTASPLMLSGLIGLLSLAGAAGIRAFRG